MANEYATAEELKAALGLSDETFADPELTSALTAASRAVDAYTNRRFYADETNQERYYTPSSTSLVVIDDLAELASFSTGADFSETWTENTDFTLGPLNPSGPWGWIETTRNLPQTARSVRITGKFGWLEPPAQVKEATMILAARLTRRVREAPFGVADFGEAGVMRIAADPDVALLLNPLRIPTVA